MYKIGITHGDVNGIGYEVIIKALAEHGMMEVCTPVVYGLAKAASYHRKYMDMPDFSFQFIKNAEQISNKRPNLINIYEEEVKIELGYKEKSVFLRPQSTKALSYGVTVALQILVLPV